MGEIRLHGRGGQGTVMAAEMMANAFVFGGKYASVFPSFGIERRGSAVMAFARYAEAPIREHTRVYNPDILLMLDQSLTDNPTCYEGFKAGGIIIANTKHEQNIIDLKVNQKTLGIIDAVSIALEETGTVITNTCMLGAFAKTTGLVELDDLKKALPLFFKEKILAGNLRSLERGFNEVQILQFSPSEANGAQKDLLSEQDPVVKPPTITTSFESAWDDVSKNLLIAKTGEWRYRRPELDKAACKLCGWCSVYCPGGCMKQEKDSYFHPDLSYCKGCGICANECPAHALKMKVEEVI